MKLYDQKEISTILKKASENTLAEGTDNPMGLSIMELKQLASDAGIDPDQIEKAAAELDADSNQTESNFWGGPFTYSNQVLIDGEITASDWEEMLISIRDFFQSKGSVTTRESVMEWSSPKDTSNAAHVTAIKNNGKTKLSVSWIGPLTALPFYLPVPLVGVASLFLANDFFELTALPGMAFVLISSGLTFLTARWGLRKHLKAGFKKLNKMVSDLEQIPSNKTSLSEKPNQTESLLKIPHEEDTQELMNESSQRNRSKA